MEGEKGRCSASSGRLHVCPVWNQVLWRVGDSGRRGDAGGGGRSGARVMAAGGGGEGSCTEEYGRHRRPHCGRWGSFMGG